MKKVQIDFGSMVDQLVGALPGLPLFLLYLVAAVMILRLVMELIQDWRNPRWTEPLTWLGVAVMIYALSFR